MSMDGEIFRAKSGQWSWRIFDEEGDIVRGAGYETEDDARNDFDEQFSALGKERTARHEIPSI